MSQTFKPNAIIIFTELLIFILLVSAATVYFNVIFLNQQTITVFIENANIWLPSLPLLLFKLVFLVSIGAFLISFEFSVIVTEQGIQYRKLFLIRELMAWSEINEYKEIWFLVPLVSLKSNATNKKCKVTASVLKSSYFNCIKKAT